MKCRVDGCESESMYVAKQLCQKHYFRLMRNGTTELVLERKKRVTGSSRKMRIENPAGYQKVYMPGHPLSESSGYVYEHRCIVYQQYGDQLPNCLVCGKKISWSTCHVDHIDENVRNNSPENLRPVCRGCNISRTPHSDSEKLTVDGETMSIMDWSRREDVTVAYKTIRARLKAGWSPRDAVFTPSKTHPKANTKKRLLKHQRLAITKDGQ